ncbi:MAG: glycosyl hydrolase family protein, partial [Ignavibacteria bacterium]|nr:glycosyl hydrolase family protein [Ignavibacteria bacterium]
MKSIPAKPATGCWSSNPAAKPPPKISAPGPPVASTARANSSTTAFHVYRIEWTPTQIRWYVDGTNYYTQEIGSIGGSPANP